MFSKRTSFNYMEVTMQIENKKVLKTDVLIIGGGTAG